MYIDRSDLSRPTLMDEAEQYLMRNIIKSGYDFLYLVSNTGNKSPVIDFLQDYLRNNFEDLNTQYTK